MDNIEGLRSTFAQFKDLNVDSYLKSLPYFLLTGRKGFYFFRDEQTSLTVAVHPHKANTLIVFPEFDGTGELTVQVLNKLSEKKFDVQLARYTEHDYQKLQFALKKDKERIISSITIREEDVLDWKYPARILDTTKVANLQGNSFGKLRNKFNKISGSDEYEIVPLSSPEAGRVIKSSIFNWLAGLALIGRETGKDVSEFYDTLTKQLVAFPSFFDGFAIKTKSEAVGFTIWDVTGNTANALAGLSKRNVSGLSEFQTVTACQILSARGVARYNLGGSETENLDTYKLKFHPAESIRMFSCDVDFENHGVLPLEMIDVFEDQKLGRANMVPVR